MKGSLLKKHGNCQNKVGTKVRQNTNSDTKYYGNQENKRKKANSNIFKFKNIHHQSLTLNMLVSWIVNITYRHKPHTVCSYRATYSFQSESAPYSYVNVKEIFAPNRSNIQSLVVATGFRPTATQFVKDHPTIWSNWLNS